MDMADKLDKQSVVKTKRSLFGGFKKNLLAGTLTLIPLWITWTVFSFVFQTLSEIGSPWVEAMSGAVAPHSQMLSKWLIDPWFQKIIAAVLTLLALYLLGIAATQVIGRQLIAFVEALINRIPFVQAIYGSTKKLLNALQVEPDKVQRVVLINFPSAPMKAIGLVTATFKDKHTNQDLAAVYVPTTPNPTSGYLEIVPTDQLVPTDMTMDEAMTFIISGGAVAPEKITFSGG